MPRVFVVNIPLTVARDEFGRVKTDPDSGSILREPSVDLAPAREFGEIISVFPPGHLWVGGNTAFNFVATARTALADFTANDYLLLLGDPLALGVAAVVAAERAGGLVTFLRWFNREKRYEPFAVDLSEEFVVPEEVT